MKQWDLFPTKVWSHELNYDNEALKRDAYAFEAEKGNTDVISNNGGYQSKRYYENEDFHRQIISNLPLKDDDLKGKFGISSWININRKTNSNNKHFHFDSGIFLSGVYYVKVPEDSGRIRFYDPRPTLISTAAHQLYFEESAWMWLQPIEGAVLYFPSWLEHDVEPSESDEDRISIAFNIIAPKELFYGKQPDGKVSKIEQEGSEV